MRTHTASSRVIWNTHSIIISNFLASSSLCIERFLMTETYDALLFVHISLDVSMMMMAHTDETYPCIVLSYPEIVSHEKNSEVLIMAQMHETILIVSIVCVRRTKVKLFCCSSVAPILSLYHNFSSSKSS